MSTLLIDSGNYSIKWAIMDRGDLTSVGRLDRVTDRSLHDTWATLQRPNRVVAGNVAGELGEENIREAVRLLWQLPVEFVNSSAFCCGITNGYAEPEKLGVDRWLAMIAARQLTDGPCIVVDCGTAVTIDLVDETGFFKGGVIMAGLGLSRAALHSGAAALDDYAQGYVTPAATSTAVAVTSGTLLGLAGAIERVVQEQSAMLDEAPVVVLSGGDAESLLMLFNFDVLMHPDLVLQGLRIFSEVEKND